MAACASSQWDKGKDWVTQILNAVSQKIKSLATLSRSCLDNLSQNPYTYHVNLKIHIITVDFFSY